MTLRSWLFSLALSLGDAWLRPGPAPAEGPPPALEVFRASQAGPFDGLLLGAAEDFGLDPWLLKGLLLNESGLQEGRSGRNGVGLAQFTPAGVAGVNAIRRRRGCQDFEPFTLAAARRPEEAIPAAAELLAAHVRRWGLEGGVAAYRCPAQAPAVRRWGAEGARRRGLLYRCGPVRMGGRYVPNVLEKTNALRRAAGLRPLP